MDSYHHQLHPKVGHLQPHQYGGGAGAETGGGGAAGDRFPQWSSQETREFLGIRGELDPTFMQTKRNKLLWEIIATKMKERGFHRSAEQCKCKWKNLVTRYKGCETLDGEGMRQQFPYYNDLQALFDARMQRILWMEAEGGSSSGGSKRMKAASMGMSSDEDEDEDSEVEAAVAANKGSKRRRKEAKGGLIISSSSNGGGGGNNNTNNNAAAAAGVREVLEEFMKQQVQMDVEWMKAVEAREEERRAREAEWRQTVEALERERLMMERVWREREEQRRAREEARAEKRDALINALLNNLIRRDDDLQG
ncbi:hypothetical protein DM860_017292 [Cuscuta australis]|uniref:Myb-like domain-containing protein n=1 Tax=Cuscuta australis TaxID=267555 RepID=A0A328E2K2_9ASTE|nr:hypothetical protein DM860_017292 [Cuscuta australis]